MDNLENIIESILFVSGNQIAISDLCEKLNIDKKTIRKVIDKLKEKYSGKSGIYLKEFSNQLQFSSNPDYVDYISAVLNPIRQRNLTKATLETAAIIAYKQPITRTEIEETRGVNSDYALNILLEHKLVTIVGRKDAVGRPALFGTTDEFLKRFGISSINELPDYDELMASIQKIRENYSDSLFNRFEPVLPPEESFDQKLADISKNNEMDQKLAIISKGSEIDQKLAELSKGSETIDNENLKADDVL